MATTTTTRRAAGRGARQRDESVGAGARATTSFMTIRYIVLILMTLFFLGPFVMALLGSFKTHAGSAGLAAHPLARDVALRRTTPTSGTRCPTRTGTRTSRAGS